MKDKGYFNASTGNNGRTRPLERREKALEMHKKTKKDRKRLKDYLAIKGRNKLLVHSMDESPKNLRVKEPRHECFHSYEV